MTPGFLPRRSLAARAMAALLLLSGAGPASTAAEAAAPAMGGDVQPAAPVAGLCCDGGGMAQPQMAQSLVACARHSTKAQRSQQSDPQR